MEEVCLVEVDKYWANANWHDGEGVKTYANLVNMWVPVLVMYGFGFCCVHSGEECGLGEEQLGGWNVEITCYGLVDLVFYTPENIHQTFSL